MKAINFQRLQWPVILSLVLGLSAGQTVASAQTDTCLAPAIEQLEAEAFEQARVSFEACDAQGNTVAAFNLGLLLEGDLLEEPDIEAAVLAYRRALDLIEARFALGLILIEGRSAAGFQYDEGRMLIASAADAGYEPAFEVYSMLWMSGAGGQEDFQEAHRWACAAQDAGREVGFMDLLTKRLTEEQRQC